MAACPGRRGRSVASRATDCRYTVNHRAGPARRAEEPVAMADVFRRLHRAAPQPADAADAAERRRARAAVDVPDRHPGLSGPRHRNVAARRRRRAVRHRQQQSGVGARRADGPSDLELPADAAGEFLGVGLLRPRQPRLRHSRRSPVHGHARRAPGGARPQDRRASIWDVAVGRSEEGQRHHGRAARREGQGDHRRRRRRLLEPRVHRRLRRADRRARCGASTRFPARASRAASRGRTPKWPRAAAARRGSPAATIRRSTSSTTAPAIRIPTTTATTARATTSTPARSSRSTPTPGSCAGTSSSRRTTCTTGTRRTCRCRPI